VGIDYECSPDVACDRAGHLAIAVDPNRLPPGETEAHVLIQVLGTDQSQLITVQFQRVEALNVSGVAGN
jgi:hypothetical protein